jgi:DNA-binding NtrC family response regulator
MARAGFNSTCILPQPSDRTLRIDFSKDFSAIGIIPLPPYLQAELERSHVKRELDNLVVQMYASGITYEEAVREFRRRYIQEVLRNNKGNQCKAARELGVHRNTLSRVMAELELDPAQIKLGLKRPPRGEHAVLPAVQLVRSR